MELNTEVHLLNKVGKTTARQLARLGIFTVFDLLYYFPFRYDDFRQVVNINDLRADTLVTIKGKIELINNRQGWRGRRRRILTEAIVVDATGSLRVIWFNQPYLIRNLKPGDEIFLAGKVQNDMLGSQLISPMYEKAGRSQPTHAARLVPIYSLTKGITEKQIRFLISQVISLAKNIKEWLPEMILKQAQLSFLPKAIELIHFPRNDGDIKLSTERLKFDELFLLQLKGELSRLERNLTKAPKMTFREQEIKEFVKNLPFILTKTQKIAAWEILQDLDRSISTNRLLSGDVGSGKTVIAAIAMYDVALNGYQSILMAPTEILATQHYQSLCQLLGDKVKIGLVTQSQYLLSNIQFDQKNKTRQKKEVLEKIAIGDIDIVVGTHALLSAGVEFKKLGLVIVDEQHRFGVEQRQMIKKKGELSPHFLSMTATPIPRSLALMLYGDLEVSIINELPPGRKKILTRLVEPVNRNKAYDFIREQVKKGRQVFVICPLIEGEEEKKSVMSEYKKLSEQVFLDLRVGYLHGKLTSKEKEEIMKKFKESELDILVSTSVIEVGVDIPNSSVMMIEGAERFGLAQLHQFRGRVGRSGHQSYCFLFVEEESSRALERLRYFEKNNDGFKLAEKDLAMRGSGEVYGTAQSGLVDLRLAKLTDYEIIKKAREAVRLVVPQLNKFPALLEKVKEWENRVHLE